MNKRPYVSPKCGHNRYIADRFQATGGSFARIFDVQNKRFITISCAACGYTELYRKQISAGLVILDFLLNG